MLVIIKDKRVCENAHVSIVELDVHAGGGTYACTRNSSIRVYRLWDGGAVERHGLLSSVFSLLGQSLNYSLGYRVEESKVLRGATQSQL